MPDARCPMPDALCPMPYARRVPHVTEKGYITHWRIAILLIFISISVTAELSKGLENQYP